MYNYHVNRGWVYRNGRQFMPVGAYYVSHYGTEKPARLAAMDKFKAAGFNCVCTPIDTGDDPLFSKCSALGISIIAEFNGSEDAIMHRYKDNPALMGVLAFDDVDNGSHTPTEVQQRCSVLAAKFPNKLVYSSGGYPDRIGAYASYIQALGFQSYPVDYEPLRSTYDALKAAYSTSPAMIGNLQAFAWPNRRWPTAEEIKHMQQSALMAGVTGILWYTYYDKNTSLPAHYAQWKAVRQATAALRDWAIRAQIEV